MKSIWWIRGLTLLLIGGTLATFAWGETIELITYFPATSQAGDLHLDSLTVGNGISSETLGNGEMLIESQLGINAIMADLQPKDRLYVAGRDDEVDQVLFLPGADTTATGKPKIQVGIGTASPGATLEVTSPRWNTSIQMGDITNPVQGDVAGLQITGENSVGYSSHLYMVKESNDKSWHINITPNDALNFVETGVADARLLLDPGGNVGIGEESPSGRLHVRGDDDTQEIVIFMQGEETGAAGTPGINVGIGTETPNSSAPNTLTGNLDANDVYLRSIGQWASQVGVLPGAMIQSVYSQNGTRLTTTSAMSQSSVPQITQGIEFLRATITPTNANNRLRIRVQAMTDHSGGNRANHMALFRVGNSNALSSIQTAFYNTGYVETAVIEFETTAGTTAPVTFTARIASSWPGETACVNGRVDIGSMLGGTVISTMVVEEIAA